MYIVGYLRERCAGEILSFTNANAASLIQLLGGTEGNRVYSDEGVGITLTSSAGGFGGKTGLYDVALPIKVDTKSGFQLAHPGDSIDLAYPTMNTRRGRVGEKIAHTVTPGNTQGYFYRFERRCKAHRIGSVHYCPTGQRYQQAQGRTLRRVY